MKQITKYSITSIIFIISLLLIFFFIDKNQKIFITNIINNIIFINANENLVRAPYPEGFIELKSTNFLDIECYILWKLEECPDKKEENSDSKIILLKNNDIYCDMRFNSDKNGIIKQESYSSFDFYKKNMIDIINDSTLNTDEEKYFLIHDDDDIIAIGEDITLEIDKAKIIKVAIGMYIDGYIIETVFAKRFDNYPTNKSFEGFYNIVKKYIERFDRIKKKDRIDNISNISEQLKSIKE